MADEMNHVDLFSGIGGFALAATWTWGEDYHNLGHSEIEKFPCKVYHRHFPESECLGDITKIDWRRFEGQVDLLTGGFPCQPHSVAGKRKGSKDERDLWGECVRALSGIRPRYAIFENVPGIITSEHGKTWERIKMDLDSAGYEGIPVLFSAAEVGAPHRRGRVWLVARDSKLGGWYSGRYTSERDNSKGKHYTQVGQLGKRPRSGTGETNSDTRHTQSDPSPTIGKIQEGQNSKPRGSDAIVADPGNSAPARQRGNGGEILPLAESMGFDRSDSPPPDPDDRWQLQPSGSESDKRGWIGNESWKRNWVEVATALCRVDDGLPRQLDRVQRLKALGNAIVPQCAEVIFRAIKELE